jgi:hypothetical protein
VSESDLYEPVQKWVRRHFRCWQTGINTGPNIGRIDVVGVRDVGGDLSGKSEVIAVEVKQGKPVFATAAGQAHGYSVMADRCYLAVPTADRGEFTSAELQIAGHLGIGLLAIRRTRIEVVLTAPPCDPIEELRLQVIEKLGLAHCSLCGTLFRRAADSPHDFKGVVRQGERTSLETAVKKQRGFMWWLWEAAEERDLKARDGVFWRRYLCGDCTYVLAHRAGDE